MPPKQRKRGNAEEEDVFTLEAETGEGPKAPVEEKHNLLDGSSLKRALDDAVMEALIGKGLAMDNTYTDIKIALGLLACGTAALAQLYPKMYPGNHFWVLLGCVAGYMLLSTLMTVVAAVYEKEAILLTKAGGSSGLPPLSVTTKLPRFGDTYTIILAPRGTGSGAADGSVSMTKGVGAYFHSDGLLAKAVIKTDTEQLLARLIEPKKSK